MERLFVDIAGWAAALLILGGYALLTAGKVDAKSPLYQAMNVLGAIGFIINSGYFKAWPSAVLNVIWAGIGIVALIRIASGRRKARAIAA
ncbi:CBU_0592 family membrane protein [Sphingomonas sp. LHG3443-2]|uniref:CBU_0592 family membrane protein n=1 Tax=Sphingomonas sp. LHG3443-2 TaxID=2804639 RepID=UPI003CEAF15C